jgi:hypothetical protein
MFASSLLLRSIHQNQQSYGIGTSQLC